MWTTWRLKTKKEEKKEEVGQKKPFNMTFFTKTQD